MSIPAALRAWLLGLGLIALLTAAGCTRSESGPTGETGATEQPAVTVPSPEVVHVAGKLVFPRNADLTFGVGGTVGEIFVSEGQRVESGDVLATLDDLLINELTQRSAQQVLALDNASDQLEDLRRNHEQQLARAKQAVAQTEFALDLAQDRLDDFQRDYNTKLARATQANAAAGLTLDQAIENLEDFQSEHSQKLAVAAEARAAAELTLDQTLDTLANADFNYGQTLAAALQAVASAELARDRAQDDLDEFQREHLRGIVHARMTTADAALAQKRALDNLADHAPAHALDLANALSAKTKAEEAFKSAENALEDFENDTTAQLALAIQAVNTTSQDLEDAKDTLDDFTLRSKAFPVPRDQEAAMLAEFHRAINEATDRLTIAQSTAFALTLTTSGRTCRDEGPDPLVQRCQELYAGIEAAAGRLANVTRELEVLQNQGEEATSTKSQSYLELQRLEAAVEVTQTALDQAGEDLTELERGPNVLQKGLLDSALEVARTRLDSALKNLQDTKTGIQSLNNDEQQTDGQQPTVAASRLELAAAQDALAASLAANDEDEIAAARARVAVAEAALAAAQESLEARTAGVDPLEVAALEARVRLLSESLISAERVLARLSEGLDPLVQATLEAAVTTAQSEFSQTQNQLASLQTSRDSLELALREQQVGLARQDVVKAQKDLAELELGPDPLETTLLEAQISSGNSALEAALEDMEGTKVRAEFSGVVSRVNVEMDDVVTDKSRIITLVDPSRVEVHGFLDGTKIQSVHPGDSAQVAIDSVNGVPLTGVVTAVSASPRTDRGVLTFPIVVQVNVPAGVTVPLELSGASFSIGAGA